MFNFMFPFELTSQIHGAYIDQKTFIKLDVGGVFFFFLALCGCSRDVFCIVVTMVSTHG
jgi:hypothetical protein